MRAVPLIPAGGDGSGGGSGGGPALSDPPRPRQIRRGLIKTRSRGRQQGGSSRLVELEDFHAGCDEEKKPFHTRRRSLALPRRRERPDLDAGDSTIATMLLCYYGSKELLPHRCLFSPERPRGSRFRSRQKYSRRCPSVAPPSDADATEGFSSVLDADVRSTALR